MIKKRYHMSQYAIANIRIPLQIVGDNYEILNDRIHIEFEKCTHLPDIQENVDNVSEQIKLLFTNHQTPSEVMIHESSDEIDDEISKNESALEEKKVKENDEDDDDDDDENKKYILHVKPTIPRNRLNITFKRKQSSNNITQKKYHS